MEHYKDDIFEEIGEESSKINNNKLKSIISTKQLMRAEWDQDSPRFKYACLKLGIDPKQDLVLKYFPFNGLYNLVITGSQQTFKKKVYLKRYKICDTSITYQD